jgi:putative hydroxymethylpyrimidine transport system permease protein
MLLLRPVILLLGLILFWQAVASGFELPPYILPGPLRVALAVGRHWPALLSNAGVTLLEILLGLGLGILFGLASALLLAFYRPARLWLLPALIASQAVPVFALAPLLVLWFGYGMTSKVVMAALIIYFPVAASFYDGLRRTEVGWLDLARTMNGGRLRILLRIQAPAALPAFASGVRVAVAVAPIGTVIGEWVGASRGLGYLMLHANGRMQIDLMFAALVVLAALGLALYFGTDRLLRAALPWVKETATSFERNRLP